MLYRIKTKMAASVQIYVYITLGIRKVLHLAFNPRVRLQTRIDTRPVFYLYIYIKFIHQVPGTRKRSPRFPMCPFRHWAPDAATRLGCQPMHPPKPLPRVPRW